MQFPDQKTIMEHMTREELIGQIAEMKEIADIWAAERDQYKDRSKALEVALRYLCNEVDALKIAENEIKTAIGNTNWEVLSHWKQKALEELSKRN